MVLYNLNNSCAALCVLWFKTSNINIQVLQYTYIPLKNIKNIMIFILNFYKINFKYFSVLNKNLLQNSKKMASTEVLSRLEQRAVLAENMIETLTKQVSNYLQNN